jgi:hypothetical protein
MLLPLVTFLVLAVILVLGVTQMILPALQGEPMFPLLRSDRRGLEVDLSAAEEALENVEIYREVENTRRAATRRMAEPLEAEESEKSEKPKKNHRRKK